MKQSIFENSIDIFAGSDSSFCLSNEHNIGIEAWSWLKRWAQHAKGKQTSSGAEDRWERDGDAANIDLASLQELSLLLSRSQHLTNDTEKIAAFVLWRLLSNVDKEGKKAKTLHDLEKEKTGDFMNDAAALFSLLSSGDTGGESIDYQDALEWLMQEFWGMQEDFRADVERAQSEEERILLEASMIPMLEQIADKFIQWALSDTEPPYRDRSAMVVLNFLNSRPFKAAVEHTGGKVTIPESQRKVIGSWLAKHIFKPFHGLPDEIYYEILGHVFLGCITGEQSLPEKILNIFSDAHDCYGIIRLAIPQFGEYHERDIT